MVAAKLVLAPASSLFEVAGAVVLAEFVFGFGPAHTVVPKACKSTVGNSNHQRDAKSEEHVRNRVIDYQALHHSCKGTGSVVTPKDASAVNRCAHKEVGKAKWSAQVVPCGSIDKNGERRAFIRTINALATGFSPEATNWGKQVEAVCLGSHNVWTMLSVSLLQNK